MSPDSSHKPGNGRSWAALGAGGATTLIALISTLAEAPWWLTVTLMGGVVILGGIYMITSAWGERPPVSPPPDVKAIVAAMREPYRHTNSDPPPGATMAETVDVRAKRPPPSPDR